MTDDIWEWFDDQEEEFEWKGDRARLAMAELHAKAGSFCETDPPRMIRLLKEGRDRARRLREPWWVYLYEVWLAMGYQQYVCDLNKALPVALHCVHEARKPELREHPFRIAAHNTLLATYLDIDPLGYADAIQECLRNLSREIPRRSFEHREVMLGHQCFFLMMQGRWKQARRLELRALARFEQEGFDKEWYILSTYLNLCEFAWRERRADELRQFGEAAEEIARDYDSRLDVSNAQVWQAVAARLDGDEQLARRQFRSAMNRTRRLRKKPEMGHYQAIVAFHELGEDLERCLEARTEELQYIKGTGRFGYEADVCLKRCELLAQLGRLKPKDLAQARASLKPLKKPQPYQQRLDKLTRHVSRKR
ncbi:MAG: hypothetical protein AB7K24_05960 [Gemmataceae bacterium]